MTGVDRLDGDALDGFFAAHKSHRNSNSRRHAACCSYKVEDKGYILERIACGHYRRIPKKLGEEHDTSHQEKSSAPEYYDIYSPPACNCYETGYKVFSSPSADTAISRTSKGYEYYDQKKYGGNGSYRRSKDYSKESAIRGRHDPNFLESSPNEDQRTTDIPEDFRDIQLPTSSEEFNKLKEENEEKQRFIDDLTAQLERVRFDKDTVQNELFQSQENNIRATEKIEALTKEYEELQSKIKEQEAKLEEVMQIVRLQEKKRREARLASIQTRETYVNMKRNHSLSHGVEVTIFFDSENIKEFFLRIEYEIKAIVLSRNQKSRIVPVQFIDNVIEDKAEIQKVEDLSELFESGVAKYENSIVLQSSDELMVIAFQRSELALIFSKHIKFLSDSVAAHLGKILIYETEDTGKAEDKSEEAEGIESPALFSERKFSAWTPGETKDYNKGKSLTAISLRNFSFEKDPEIKDMSTEE